MVVERIHALVRPIKCPGLEWNLHAALVQNLVYVLGVQILQVVKVYRLQELLLSFCQLCQVLLL